MIQHTCTSIRLSNTIKDNNARFLVGDLNLAMPDVARVLRDSGVDCVLLEYHVELELEKHRNGNLSIVKDSDGNATLLFDTVGIWSLGPLGIYGCLSSSPWAHILGGLRHPFPKDKDKKNVRGFRKTANWKGELPDVKLTKKDVSVCEGILEQMRLFNGDQEEVTKWEREMLPGYLRLCKMQMHNHREKRGEGVGFRDIHQPGLRV